MSQDHGLFLTEDQESEYCFYWEPLGYRMETYLRWSNVTLSPLFTDADRFHNEPVVFRERFQESFPKKLEEEFLHSFTHEEAEAWWDIVGGNAFRAARWISLGFTLESARLWYDSEVNDPFQARSYQLLGVSPSSYFKFFSEFYEEFSSHNKLYMYLRSWCKASGRSGDQSVSLSLKWYALHHSKGAALALEAYVVNEHEKLDPNNNAGWRISSYFRMSPYKAKRYIELGAHIDEAIVWEEAHRSVDELAEYVDSGVPVSLAIQNEC